MEVPLVFHSLPPCDPLELVAAAGLGSAGSARPPARWSGFCIRRLVTVQLASCSWARVKPAAAGSGRGPYPHWSSRPVYHWVMHSLAGYARLGEDACGGGTIKLRPLVTGASDPSIHLKESEVM
ncbi:UNVERIFIED_CONTAM: hypothetical protein K2H54_030478 [Gekko kuhli]